MSNRERAKGLRGELAVRRIFEQYDWTVRGLEAQGDQLAFRDGIALHVEAKDQAVLRLPLWIRQATVEAPEGTCPVVVYKLDGRWRADLPAHQFAACHGRPW